MARNHQLVGKPAAVAGNPQKRAGIILAANYEARKYGVKTAMILHEALRRCPNMLIVPPDHSYYRRKSIEVMDLLSNYTPILEQNSIDEAWLDMTGTEHLFGSPIQAANKIMEDIKTNLGLWCSIGISNNKFLSKMASEMKKPLGITELYTKDIQTKLWPLPIDRMHGIGKRTAGKLIDLNIKTIGDLANYDKDILAKKIGKYALDLQLHAKGIDYSQVMPNSPDDIKSIGRSTTLPNDTNDINYLEQVLLELAEEVGKTARRYCKKGRVVHITIKYSDFTSISRQRTLHPTNSTQEIYKTGCDLIRKNINPLKPVRLIGITLKDFDVNRSVQQLSFLEGSHSIKNDRIDRIMDELQNKYGVERIGRGSTFLKKNGND